MYKCYSFVPFFLKPIENIGVENEDGKYWGAGAEGVVQSCIIVQSKIAAKPEYSNGWKHEDAKISDVLVCYILNLLLSDISGVIFAKVLNSILKIQSCKSNL